MLRAQTDHASSVFELLKAEFWLAEFKWLDNQTQNRLAMESEKMDVALRSGFTGKFSVDPGNDLVVQRFGSPLD